MPSSMFGRQQGGPSKGQPGPARSTRTANRALAIEDGQHLRRRRPPVMTERHGKKGP